MKTKENRKEKYLLSFLDSFHLFTSMLPVTSHSRYLNALYLKITSKGYKMFISVLSGSLWRVFPRSRCRPSFLGGYKRLGYRSYVWWCNGTGLPFIISLNFPSDLEKDVLTRWNSIVSFVTNVTVVEVVTRTTDPKYLNTDKTSFKPLYN